MDSKKCSKCGLIKSINDFSVHKASLIGFRSQCKKCGSEAKKAIRKTKKGVASRMLEAQKTSCKKRKMNMPSYTTKEFYKWVLSHPLFDKLYIAWVESNYDKNLKPSVDRLDDYKSYSFDNIQLVTWEENMNKSFIDRKEGRNNKTNKSVVQLDKNGVLIKTFHSVRCAGRDTNINATTISLCCLNKLKTAGGYNWEYKE